MKIDHSHLASIKNKRVLIPQGKPWTQWAHAARLVRGSPRWTSREVLNLLISALARKRKFIFFSLASLDNNKILVILIITIFMLVFPSNFSYARYVYDIEAENRRNERQEPKSDPYEYIKSKEDKRNEKQRVRDDKYKYDKKTEDRRNERQDIENNPGNPNAALDRIRNERQEVNENDRKKDFRPQRSPFIDMFLKDYSNVKNRSEFTDRYVKDYSNLRNRSEFTDRYLQDYSDISYPYYNNYDDWGW